MVTRRRSLGAGLVLLGVSVLVAAPLQAGTAVGSSATAPAAPGGIDVTAVADVVAPAIATASGSEAVLPCIGDGVSGKRVQMVYATASDVVDDYSTVAPTLAGIAAQMDQAVSDSAAVTGGTRHIRFVTAVDCSLDIAHVVLSPTGDDTFGSMITELRSKGFASNDRKYVVWMNARVYCGISQAFSDSTAGPTNLANTTVGYARVDRGCWGQAGHLVEVHELVHTLGGVQPTAPHGTAQFHCTDESDAMCYSDAAGVTMTWTCPTTSERLLDCGGDDYFSTAPVPGSYLATHWNVADSGFLSAGLVDPAPAPAPATVTDTFTGSTTAKSLVRVHSGTTGAGAATASLSFAAGGRVKTAPSARLRLLAADGSVVASGSGSSTLVVPATLAAGTYKAEITSTVAVSYTLTVTHVAAS